jgi:polygalacturonase
VKTVRIMDGVAEGCTSSFVTADGEDIIIENCTADGVDATKSYDAVSIHSGINVKVLSNTFKKYGLGQVVNVRNSPENKCGSSNINVLSNTFEDCPTMGTQVSIQAGETVYGVQDVLIRDNTYKNVKQAVLITSGSGEVGTPFK